MFALLLYTLFAASASLALGTIGSSWHRHGGAALAVPRQLHDCGLTRELRFKLVTTSVGGNFGRAEAKIYRVDFRQPARSLPLRTPAQSGLRAAA